MVGDTSSSDPQLTDEEIDYTLTKYTSTVGAAINCCDCIISKYTRLVTQSVGQISINYSDRIKQYKELIVRLRLRSGAVKPYMGGATLSDKEAQDEDEDRNAPTFKMGMFDRNY